MSQSGKVIIVGGGFIGLWSAWYLRRQGWRVTIIDRQTIGSGCSQDNCGLVCPSHVLPLTEPGAFQAALKALLTPHSPFRIQPRLDPALWSWLWNFSRRCNHTHMLSAAHAIQALLASGMREYLHWLNEEQMDCEWQSVGLLYVYQQAAELQRYAVTNRLLAEHFNEPAQLLTAQQTVELEPALRDSVAGSWYYEHDAHLRPDRLIAWLRQRLADDGVELIENCQIDAVRGAGSQAQRLATSQGEMPTDALLFACGAWSPQLKELIGCKLPIQPGKGYSITMPRPQSCPRLPLIFPETRVVATPMHSGYRLGSIMEFAGYDKSVHPERLQLLRSGAEPYLKEPYCQPELSHWFGWRPMTYDSLPIIDRTPRWGNAWVATGHNMLGLSMGPATGRLIAELMQGATPHVDPAPYSVSRF